jgi:hypothetical protein
VTRPLRVALVCQRSAKLPIVFESARRNGFQLFTVMALGEEASYAEHADVICGTLSLDVFGDPKGSAAAFVRSMQENHLDGLVTTREEAIPWVAEVAHQLGRPALSKEAVVACRDKNTMRGLLREHGLNQPRSESLTLNEAVNQIAAGTLQFPLVIKPRFGIGSLGVSKVETLAQLTQHYDNAVAVSTKALSSAVGSQPYFSHTLLVEEFIGGPEIVADAFSVGGEVKVCSIAYKGDAPGPYFERSVYEAPMQLPTSLAESVRDQVVRGLAAVGLRDGPSHTEMRLAPGGNPYIIEIGARVGGSGVSSFIVEASTGVDLFYLHVLQACGVSIRLEHERPSRELFAGNFVIPMQGHGEFVAYQGLDQVRAHPATRHVVTFFEPGLCAEPVPNFFGFPGFIMSQHDSAESLRRYHQWLFEVARIEWKPSA